MERFGARDTSAPDAGISQRARGAIPAANPWQVADHPHVGARQARITRWEAGAAAVRVAERQPTTGLEIRKSTSQRSLQKSKMRNITLDLVEPFLTALQFGIRVSEHFGAVCRSRQEFVRVVSSDHGGARNNVVDAFLQPGALGLGLRQDLVDCVGDQFDSAPVSLSVALR
jgi:hypothetical protein